MNEATLDLHVFVLDALMAMKGDKAASDFVEQRMLSIRHVFLL